MSDLASRSFVLTPTTDRYLTLANEEIVRTFTMGNSWTQIRLGLLIAITNNSTSGLSACKFIFGVCSGNTHPYADPSTVTNFTGMDVCTFNTTVGSLVYNANSGNPTWSNATNLSGAIIKKVATTQTQTTPGNLPSGYFAQNNGSTQRRSPVFMDITKGSPNYSYKLHFLGSLADAAADYSYAQFFSTLESPAGTLTCGAATLNNSGSGSLAMDESAGNLDSMNVFWNKTLYPLEIYAMAAYKVS